MIWLKRTGLGLGAFVLFVVLTLLFVSGERLCNFGLQQLSERGVSVVYASKNSHPLGCSIQEGMVYFNSLPIAIAGSVSVDLTALRLKNVTMQGVVASSYPYGIERIDFSPLTGSIGAKGDFGNAEGTVSLFQRRIHLLITPTNKFPNELVGLLHLKNENGKYVYDKTF